MNPINRELLRVEILRIAENSLPQAVSIQLLLVYLRPVFSRCDEGTLVREVLYLVEKEMLRQAAKLLSPENKLWIITADGRDFLAAQGLE